MLRENSLIMTKCNIIIQARMNSKRLPGKMMLDLFGYPILYHILKRLKKCKKVNKIILAIPNNGIDEILAEVASDVTNIEIVRGSEENLIKRFFIAANDHRSDYIIRFPADNPFPDPEEIDKLVDFHVINNTTGFSSNIASVFDNGMIDGVGAEIFSYKLLKQIVEEKTTKEQKEHIHLNFYDYKTKKAIKHNVSVMAPKPDLLLQRPEFALDINTIDQYFFIRNIYKNVCFGKTEYKTKDIIKFLDFKEIKRA